MNIPRLLTSNNNENEYQLLGDIGALSFYRYTGQENFTQQISSGEIDSHDIIYYSNDTFIRLAEGSASTRVEHIVPFGDDSFILSGSGSILGFNLENQLLFNLSDLSVHPIFWDQRLNQVNTILVDGSKVYFGGSFTYNNGSLVGYSTCSWDALSNKTSLLPFVGFGKNSVVNDIIKLDDDTILFAGSFSSVQYNQTGTLPNTPNVRHINGTSVLTFNSTANSQLQLNPPISLREGTTWAVSGSHFNPEEFICPSAASTNLWFTSGTSGTITCYFSFDHTLSKIRIYNSPDLGSSVSFFRLLTEPARSIMNLTYIDPTTGDLKHCDAYCPLLSRQELESAANAHSGLSNLALTNDNTTALTWGPTFQDFGFVNMIDAYALSFIALSSYGSDVALSGFELYQNSYVVYPNDTFNYANCGDNRSASVSSSLSANDWSPGVQGQSFISTYYRPNSGPIPRVVYTADIKYPGDFVVNIYTPGCREDNTCSTRGIVNVTVWNVQTGQMLNTMEIYQNNDDAKYNELYSGYLESSVKITLEYVSPISRTALGTTVVADRVTVLISGLDILDALLQQASLNSESQRSLNGIYQYDTMNSSSASTRAVNNLDQYAMENFKTNVSLIAAKYQSDEILIGGQDTGLTVVNLSNGDTSAIQGSVTDLTPVSNGIFISGDLIYLSRHSNALFYDGMFSVVDDTFTNSTIVSANNITLGDSELLVLNNRYIYNFSDSTTISNSSAFSLSLWSSGMNGVGDLLFSGAVSEMQYGDLSGAVAITNGNAEIDKLNLPQNVDIYMGAYLNESQTVYAYNMSGQNMLYLTDNTTLPWTWTNEVTALLYSGNQSMLIVGTSANSPHDRASILIVNTTTYEVLLNSSLSEGSTVTSALNFVESSTLLIGGKFTIPNINCSGLCLYNYGSKSWSPFANNSITGTFSRLQFYSESSIIIAGEFNTDEDSDITLALVDLATYEVTVLRSGPGLATDSFIVSDNSVVGWNSSVIFTYNDRLWSFMKPFGGNTSTDVITGVQAVQLQGGTLAKRQSSDSTTDALLVYGDLSNSEYGKVQAAIRDPQGNWVPYLLINGKEFGTANSPAKFQFFIDADMSPYHNSRFKLQGSRPVTVTTSPSATETQVTTETSTGTYTRRRRKIDRGWVVLIGLALALGTISVLGVVGVILAYLFKEDTLNYEPLNLQIDEDKMIETIPPENLRNHVS